MDVFEKFSAYANKHQLLKKDERVVVGVSGGPDSLCLLDLISRMGAIPIVAHLDHQLRPESVSEAIFVRDFAEERDLQCELGKIAVETLDGGSIEERARLARYRFLVEIAHKHSIAKLAVGHTYDDQVETILMHFVRGAGPTGLRGMLPSTEMSDWVGVPDSAGITIVRPLLPVTHDETLTYCREAGLKPRFDRSNQDETLFRNRIRHHLLPILEQYNPGVRAVIYRLGEVMRAEVDYLNSQVESHWLHAAQLLNQDVVILRAEPFHDVPLALQRGLLRRAIAELRPEIRDMGFEHIERALEFFLGDERSASVPVIDDLLLYDYGEDAVLAPRDETPLLPDYPQIKDALRLDDPPEQEVSLANGWRIRITEHEEIDLADAVTDDSDAWQVHLDRQQLVDPLVLRNRQPGDRIQPLGMQGSMKVSDLMTNRKVPRLARDHWPLLASADQIAWVPGLHLGHPFRVRNATRRVLWLQALPPS